MDSSQEEKSKPIVGILEYLSLVLSCCAFNWLSLVTFVIGVQVSECSWGKKIDEEGRWILQK